MVCPTIEHLCSSRLWGDLWHKDIAASSNIDTALAQQSKSNIVNIRANRHPGSHIREKLLRLTDQVRPGWRCPGAKKSSPTFPKS